MKILYVTTISNTVNAFLIPHIKMLVEQGHKVDIASNVVQEIDPEIVKLNCKIHNIEFIRSPIRKENFKAYKKIRKLVMSGEYQLVHTHTPIASFITKMACRSIPDLKVIYTAHGFHFHKGASLKNWLNYYPLEFFSSKYVDSIITINQEDYNAASKMKNKRLKLVFKCHGVGINLEKFKKIDIEKKDCLRHEYGYKKEDFILIYAAELNLNKHQDLLINAIKELKNSIPNIKLLLAGEGSFKDKYQKMVCEFDLAKHVDFLGYRNDISNLLALSDLAVSASRREGLPVNIMEAMATGLPVVVTNCRGNQDLIKNEENGYVVGINNIEEFKSSVLKLYNSNNLRETFGKKNIDLIKTFSIDNVNKELKDIYVNFLKE